MELLYGFAETVLDFLEAALGADVVFGVVAMVETLLLMPFSLHSHSHSEKRGWCREGGEWRQRRQIGMKGVWSGSCGCLNVRGESVRVKSVGYVG